MGNQLAGRDTGGRQLRVLAFHCMCVPGQVMYLAAIIELLDGNVTMLDYCLN